MRSPVTIDQRAGGHPAGWKWVPITDVAELATGHTPDRARPDYWNGGIPWISLTEIRNLDGRYATETDVQVSAAGIRNSSAVVLPAGTVCFSRTASIGFVTIMGAPMATSQDFVNWICGDDLDPRYLMYALRCSRRELFSLSAGSTHKTIYVRVAEMFRVLLPPLSEQRRIADILARADAVRAKRRRAINRWNLLGGAIFNDVFGDPSANPKDWPRASIGDCSTRVTDGEHATPDRTSSGIKLLSARNVRNGYLDLANVDFIGPAEFERIRKRCEPVRGDVLISCSGTIGRVAPVETDEPFTLVRSAALVRPDPTVVRTPFVHYMLRTPALQRQMARSANTSSQANLFQRQIRELSILRPPLEVQDTFAEKVAAVERQSARQRVSMAQLDALLASLQHRAFRGEL